MALLTEKIVVISSKDLYKCTQSEKIYLPLDEHKSSRKYEGGSKGMDAIAAQKLVREMYKKAR